jgi:large conductance mechanosensitive channel
LITIKSAAEGVQAVTLNYGKFINTIIDFLIVASAVFLLIRVLNALKKKEEVVPAAPTQRDCPECLMPIPLEAKRCGHCTAILR